jgi:hypothetical protein
MNGPVRWPVRDEGPWLPGTDSPYFPDRRRRGQPQTHAGLRAAPSRHRGAVSGTYFTSRGQAISFAGRPGRFRTVNDPAAPAFSTLVSAINDPGGNVGTYTDARGVIHGFIDRHGRYTTFNDPNAGTKAGQGTGASAISNLGLIVGIYFDGSGTVHGFTFTPAR